MFHEKIRRNKKVGHKLNKVDVCPMSFKLLAAQVVALSAPNNKVIDIEYKGNNIDCIFGKI